MKKILVTGGAGYIGSHTCKALAKSGFLPICYDNLQNGHREMVRWGPLEKGNIADRASLDYAFSQHQPEAVIHFAAFAYVGESIEQPEKYYRNNVAGTLTLLEAMKDHGIDKLVFSSTCATYGIPRSIPIPEDHPQKPISPYGASKWMVERMIEDFSVAHAFKAICLRYFNAAGADHDAEIGEAHHPETHLVPLAIHAATGVGGGALHIYGNDYDTPDGTCIRDYIHVSDLADAHVLALNAVSDCENNMAYNLSNGHGFSVREVIESVERVTGLTVPILNRPRRQGDPPILVGDSRRIREELGWRPQLTDLDDIVNTAWQWFRKCTQA
jgi:UDP-arabinose 4-epimerase